MVTNEEGTIGNVRLMLVDDHEVVRLGLKSLIERFPRIDIVAEAGSESEAVEQALKFRPDVILMDIRMPQMDGLEATSIIIADADTANATEILLDNPWMNSDRRSPA